jgi:hypothetical protein
MGKDSKTCKMTVDCDKTAIFVDYKSLILLFRALSNASFLAFCTGPLPVQRTSKKMIPRAPRAYQRYLAHISRGSPGKARLQTRVEGDQ